MDASPYIKCFCFGEPRTYTQNVYQGQTSTKEPFYSFVNWGDTYLKPILSGSFVADGVARSPFDFTYTMTCGSAVVTLRMQGTIKSPDTSTQATFNSDVDLFLDENHFIKSGKAVILKTDGTSQTVKLEEICTRR